MRDETAIAADIDVDEDAARVAIARLLRVDVASLRPDASLAEDLKVDSLEFIALIVGLERRFDVDLPDAKAARIRTVSEMIDFLVVMAGSRSRHAALLSG